MERARSNWIFGKDDQTRLTVGICGGRFEMWNLLAFLKAVRVILLQLATVHGTMSMSMGPKAWCISSFKRRLIRFVSRRLQARFQESRGPVRFEISKRNRNFAYSACVCVCGFCSTMDLHSPFLRSWAAPDLHFCLWHLG